MTACNAIIIRCPECGAGYHHTAPHVADCLADVNPHYPRHWPADGRCKCGAVLPNPDAGLFTEPTSPDVAGLLANVRAAEAISRAAINDAGRSERSIRQVRRLADRLDRMAEQLAAGVIDYDDLGQMAGDAGAALGCIPGQPVDGPRGWIPPTPEIAAQLQAARATVAAIRALNLPAAPRLASDGRLADLDDLGRLVLPCDRYGADVDLVELGPEPWWRRHFAGGSTAPVYVRVDASARRITSKRRGSLSGKLAAPVTAIAAIPCWPRW